MGNSIHCNSTFPLESLLFCNKQCNQSQSKELAKEPIEMHEVKLAFIYKPHLFLFVFEGLQLFIYGLAPDAVLSDY